MKISFFLLVALISIVSYGQTGTIRGVFQDRDEKKGIPLAEIELMSPDSAMIDVTFTDLEGKFNIRKVPFGDYIIKFKCFGYANSYLNIRLKTTEELILETVKIRTMAAEIEAEKKIIIRYSVPLIDRD
jgi:hypothetical protein